MGSAASTMAGPDGFRVLDHPVELPPARISVDALRVQAVVTDSATVPRVLEGVSR